jgi:hypothetical protein
MIDYLLLVHQNNSHLEMLLLELLELEHTKIFIHVDAKQDISHFKERFNNKRIVFCSERYETLWGSLEIVKAMLELMRLSEKLSNNKHFHFMSGSDFPVKSQRYIKEFFEIFENSIFLDFAHFPVYKLKLGGMDRFEKFWFHSGKSKEIYDISPLSLKGNNILNLLRILKNCSYYKKIYGVLAFINCIRPRSTKKFGYGEMWWGGNKKIINIILIWLNRNHYFMRDFEFFKIPDESFFQTLLLQEEIGSALSKHGLEHIKESLTFADWSLYKWPRPTYYFQDDYLEIEVFKNILVKKLFFRKVDIPNNDAKLRFQEITHNL